jgi:hypothetical protein
MYFINYCGKIALLEAELVAQTMYLEVSRSPIKLKSQIARHTSLLYMLLQDDTC